MGQEWSWETVSEGSSWCRKCHQRGTEKSGLALADLGSHGRPQSLGVTCVVWCLQRFVWHDGLATALQETSLETVLIP